MRMGPYSMKRHLAGRHSFGGSWDDERAGQLSSARSALAGRQWRPAQIVGGDEQDVIFGGWSWGRLTQQETRDNGLDRQQHADKRRRTNNDHGSTRRNLRISPASGWYGELTCRV